jgi:transposase
MYPTDLTETQWQFIEKTSDLGTRKRKHSLRLIWNAINYLVKSGCQWRMLPCNFPKWQLVYYYYSKWADLEYFDLLLSKLTERVRINKGQNTQASLGIIDSQSVRWGNNRSLNGFDGNKKSKGIKRHIVVDKNGFLLAIMVTLANVHDSKAVLLLMRALNFFYALSKLFWPMAGTERRLLSRSKPNLDTLFKA